MRRPRTEMLDLIVIDGQTHGIVARAIWLLAISMCISPMQ
jgi:hypothetical protein